VSFKMMLAALRYLFLKEKEKMEKKEKESH